MHASERRVISPNVGNMRPNIAQGSRSIRKHGRWKPVEMSALEVLSPRADPGSILAKQRRTKASTMAHITFWKTPVALAALAFVILPLQAIVGFFPNPERKGNIHYFSDNELEVLRIIECLKKSGLGIKDIKQFFIWVSEGNSSYEKKKRII